MAGGTGTERLDPRRSALLVYDACRRALAPEEARRRAEVRPVLEAWVRLIAACRAAGLPIVYTTPVSRAAVDPRRHHGERKHSGWPV